MFYRKIISYMSLYENGQRSSNAGHIQLIIKDQVCQLNAYLKNIPVMEEKELDVYTIGTERLIDRIKVSGGQGYYKSTWDVNNIFDTGIQMQEIQGLFIRINADQYVIVRWDKLNVPKQSKRDEEIKEKVVLAADKNIEGKRKDKKEEVEKYYEDKWEQLLHVYPQVDPFLKEDGSLHISIQLKDFIILRQDFQKMVNNSFLLHGFYNYRHILLSRYCGKEEYIYYIGVPGTFYEREKMIAAMFGFEGFEIAEDIKEKKESIQNKCMLPQGTFGYYMKRVAL